MDGRHYGRRLALALAATALSACTTPRVTTDINRNASVSACHAYAWATHYKVVHGAEQAFANPVNESRLRDAIAANLQAKGLRPASEPAGADCTVGYSIGTRTIVEGESYPAWGWGWGWGWGGWGPGGYMGAWDYPYVYNEGRIAVDLYDARTHQPIWHASVNEDVTELTGTAAQHKIDVAVAAIFAEFPRVGP